MGRTILTAALPKEGKGSFLPVLRSPCSSHSGTLHAPVLLRIFFFLAEEETRDKPHAETVERSRSLLPLPRERPEEAPQHGTQLPSRRSVPPRGGPARRPRLKSLLKNPSEKPAPCFSALCSTVSAVNSVAEESETPKISHHHVTTSAKLALSAVAWRGEEKERFKPSCQRSLNPLSAVKPASKFVCGPGSLY